MSDDVLKAAYHDDLTRQLLIDADEMEGCGAGNEAANMRRLVADCLELRAALEPFAKACDDCVDNEPDRAHIWEHAAAMEITFGNLRKARTALSKGMR